MTPTSNDDLQPPRLRLQRVHASQAATILAGGQPDGILFAEGYPSEITLEVLGRVAKGSGDDGTETFIIVRSADDCAIGGIGLWFPEGPATPRVGYDIIEPLQRQGFASEALSILRDDLFSRPGIDAVRADTEVGHSASRRVMENAGMVHIDNFEGEEDGQTVEMVLYEVKRPTS